MKRASAALCVVTLVAACALILAAREREPASAADRGRALFTARFTPERGLGPLFNERSCAGCHLEPTVGGVGRDGLATVVRVGKLTRGAFVVGRRGPVAPAHAVSELGVACDLEPGIPAGVNVTSVRNAPPLFGSDRIDAIPDAVIRAGAVARGDGVRGRPNLVRGPDGRTRVGRFGWKAHVATLEQFVAEAFRSELGVTSPLAPADARASRGRACAERSRDSEVSRGDLAAVVAFLAALPTPAPERAAPAGAQVFQQTGCAACHVPALSAGRREVELYSDLLLHDMGRTLDDGVVQGSAAGQDWRTTPLWGLGHRTRFLHDGRARNVQAAILDHGGEAQRARQRFRALSDAARGELLAFLRGL
jgi:CxxC motif-containing protein (DUF1111 family)